jgi:hypothetical protein
LPDGPAEHSEASFAGNGAAFGMKIQHSADAGGIGAVFPLPGLLGCRRDFSFFLE